jgi:hypothetical protein
MISGTIYSAEKWQTAPAACRAGAVLREKRCCVVDQPLPVRWHVCRELAPAAVRVVDAQPHAQTTLEPA